MKAESERFPNTSSLPALPRSQTPALGDRKTLFSLIPTGAGQPGVTQTFSGSLPKGCDFPLCYFNYPSAITGMRDSLKMLHILLVLELSVFFFQTLVSWVEAALEEQPHSSLVPTRASSWEARPSWSREWSHVAATMSQLALLGLLSPHSVLSSLLVRGSSKPNTPRGALL